MSTGALLAALTALCLVGSAARGQTPTQGQDLSQAANDPTASLAALQVADWYTADFHELSDDEANSVVLRAVVPFRTGSLSHIMRATAPFITDHPLLHSGLADITLFDLVVFERSWGRFGVGPVALLPTGGSDRGTEKWAVGPALGFAARSQKLLWGVFNQNLFSVAGDDDRSDVDVTILQPILTYALGNGWSAGVSEMTFSYDWEADRWSSLPLGAKVSKLLRVQRLPVQLSAEYEYDFADDEVGPESTVRFTVKLLFPLGGEGHDATKGTE